MNSIKIYESLINKAKNRTYDIEYFENHHIIPRCFGGSDKTSNIVKLSYREHYLAHWLLVKIQTDYHKKLQMSCAFLLMSKSNNGKRNTNSKMYDKAKQYIF